MSPPSPASPAVYRQSPSPSLFSPSRLAIVLFHAVNVAWFGHAHAYVEYALLPRVDPLIAEFHAFGPAIWPIGRGLWPIWRGLSPIWRGPCLGAGLLMEMPAENQPELEVPLYHH